LHLDYYDFVVENDTVIKKCL